MWPIGHGFGQLDGFGHGFGHYFSPHLGLKSYTKLLSNGQINRANYAQSEPEANLMPYPPTTLISKRIDNTPINQ